MVLAMSLGAMVAIANSILSMENIGPLGCTEKMYVCMYVCMYIYIQMQIIVLFAVL